MPKWLMQLWNDITTFSWALLQSDLTSTMGVAVISACAGAFAGAYAAQRIAERAKSKENLVEEIRSMNAGVSVAHSIFNSYFALKKQHVASLKAEFENQKTAVENEISKQQNAGVPSEVVHFQADFQTLEPIIVPIDRLQTVVFEKLSVVGRPLSLVTALVQTVLSLNRAIVERNQLIREFRANPPTSEVEKVQLYFGFPDRHGNIDENFSTYIDALYAKTDDCIYFSKVLIEDLSKYGDALKQSYEKQFRGTAPTITKVDFTSMEFPELMPSPEKYAAWTRPW